MLASPDDWIIYASTNLFYFHSASVSYFHCYYSYFNNGLLRREGEIRKSQSCTFQVVLTVAQFLSFKTNLSLGFSKALCQSMPKAVCFSFSSSKNEGEKVKAVITDHQLMHSRWLCKGTWGQLLSWYELAQLQWRQWSFTQICTVEAYGNSVVSTLKTISSLKREKG